MISHTAVSGTTTIIAMIMVLDPDLSLMENAMPTLLLTCIHKRARHMQTQARATVDLLQTLPAEVSLQVLTEFSAQY